MSSQTPTHVFPSEAEDLKPSTNKPAIDSPNHFVGAGFKPAHDRVAMCN